MGHKDIDYEGKIPRELSCQFDDERQNRGTLSSLF